MSDSMESEDDMADSNDVQLNVSCSKKMNSRNCILLLKIALFICSKLLNELSPPLLSAFILHSGSNGHSSHQNFAEKCNKCVSLEWVSHENSKNTIFLVLVKCPSNQTQEFFTLFLIICSYLVKIINFQIQVFA